MRLLDWLVLGGSLAFIVLYGLWRGRGSQDLNGYLLADRSMRWPTIWLSIMATQASAITFLSTPGQGFADGMRFVQFYFGLPVAMVVLSIAAVPVFHRLKVFTAYEYLETRFDLKTRSLASFLFLIQRGLAAGLTIYAPSLILSVLLGWNLHWTNLITGVLVIIYTAAGGTKAVNHTQFHQMLIIFAGMAVALGLIVQALPPDVSLLDGARVAGTLGRLQAVDLSFDLHNRYNLWSGLIGGCFLALSYFGTDQSQVGRYLAGRSITESRIGLLCNGLVKVPMQFVILLVGVMVFVFYQFVPPPLFFNPVEVERIRSSEHATEYRAIEERYREVLDEKRTRVRELIRAKRLGDERGVAEAERTLRESQASAEALRRRGVELMRANDAGAQTSDTNYVFLSFVLHYFPVGVIGLVLAAIFAASMSSTSAELNALASTTVVDIYRRLGHKTAAGPQEVRVSKIATVLWGAFAIGFAEFAHRLGSLIEAVNILGSLFYGTILGIFLVAFYARRVGGSAVFVAALVAEAAVVACFLFSTVSFLWYNVIGCLLVVVIGWALSGAFPRRAVEPATRT